MNEKADEKHVDELVNAMSNRKVMVRYSNDETYEFLVKHRKEFLTKLLKEGLSENDVIDIVVSKEPEAIHTLTLTGVAINLKNGKPIDPLILANRTKLRKGT